jgi:hypothetical protein
MLVYYFEIFCLAREWTSFNYMSPIISVASLSIILSTYMVTTDGRVKDEDYEKIKQMK